MKLSTVQFPLLEFTSPNAQHRLYDIGPSCWPVHKEFRGKEGDDFETYGISWKRNSYHFIMKSTVVGWSDAKPVVKTEFNVVHNETFIGRNYIWGINRGMQRALPTPQGTLVIEDFKTRFKDSNIEQPFICIQVR